MSNNATEWGEVGGTWKNARRVVVNAIGKRPQRSANITFQQIDDVVEEHCMRTRGSLMRRCVSSWNSRQGMYDRAAQVNIV